jgi:hypothetical protein
MSIQVKSVPIVTDGSGDALNTVRAGGVILRQIRIELGTLTTPDITITEEPEGTSILALTGLNADKTVTPLVVGQDDAGEDIVGSAAALPVYSRIQIQTAGGGNAKTGRVVFLLER